MNSDFSDFIRFFPIFRLFPTFRLLDSTTLVVMVVTNMKYVLMMMTKTCFIQIRKNHEAVPAPNLQFDEVFHLRR